VKTPIDPERTISATIAAEAGAWDARLRAPDCTDEDRAQFTAWRDADPTHREAFEHLQAILSTLRHERGRADARALRDEALRGAGQRRRRVWLTAAAASVFAVALGVIVWTKPGKDWLSEPLAALISRFSGANVYATHTGQRSIFVLEDGSSIELNARSKVEVRLSDARRAVKLVAGQALFTVAKDPGRPFVVHAGDRQVLALGTRFDVRLDSRSVQVTLLEGKVRVEQDARTAGAPISRLAREIELTPGMQLVARLNTGPQVIASTRVAASSAAVHSVDVVRDIDVAKVTGWREGRIYFDDLSLEEAVAEMNRHSNVQIRVGSPALAGLRVNGMFKAGEQETFVLALEEYFPITAQRGPEREIILLSR
jgi:transmembrane sensor